MSQLRSPGLVRLKWAPMTCRIVRHWPRPAWVVSWAQQMRPTKRISLPRGRVSAMDLVESTFERSSPSLGLLSFSLSLEVVMFSGVEF